MRSIFTVVTPAADPTLLTVAQLRVAAGLSADDDSQDVQLADLNKRVSLEIAQACGIRSDGVNIPTLRQETISESFRQRGWESEIFLGRRFITDIVSATEADIELTADDYLLDGEAGMISRVSNFCDLPWARGDAVIQYKAGFSEVPGDLAGAAMDLVQQRLSEAATDPLEKSRTVEVPDVETTSISRWVGTVPGSDDTPVPAGIMARIRSYATIVIG